MLHRPERAPVRPPVCRWRADALALGYYRFVERVTLGKQAFMLHGFVVHLVTITSIGTSGFYKRSANGDTNVLQRFVWIVAIHVQLRLAHQHL